MLYCDRALTNIKLKNYRKVKFKLLINNDMITGYYVVLYFKVLDDCDWALRINEKSFKARLYKTKAYKELEEIDNFDESKREVEEMFPQHQELITYFLSKEENFENNDE